MLKHTHTDAHTLWRADIMSVCVLALCVCGVDGVLIILIGE